MTFKERLQEAMRRGDMTVADLRSWFERPYPTVRYWLFLSRPDWEPSGPRGRLFKQQLKLLEYGIEHGLGFPIPENLSITGRPQYIRGQRHAINARVSASDPA